MVAAFIYLLHRHLLARSRAATLLREEKEWFGTTLGSIGDAVIATDSMGRVVFLNAVANALTGWTQAQAVGQPLDLVLQIVDAETKTRIESPALRRLRNGSTFDSASQKILIGKDGAERFIDDSAAPIRDAQRGVLGTVLVFRDITDRRRAEESLRFLAESGTILSSSLNYDATLKNVARLACNAISDYCFFDLMTEEGGVKRVAWAHKDPAKLAKMGDIWRFVPAKEFKHDPVIKTVSTGKTEFVPRVDDRWMRNSTIGSDYYQYMRELECCSFMAVPVAVKGRTLGALSFCLTAASKVFSRIQIGRWPKSSAGERDLPYRMRACTSNLGNPLRNYVRPTAVRTPSWPCSRMNCAIRLRHSIMGCRSSVKELTAAMPSKPPTK